jgi:hypothetical protein
MQENDISDCSSTSPVSVPPEHKGTSAVKAGGFAGEIANDSNISTHLERCYATGAVSSYGTGTQYTGGFVGCSNMNTTVDGNQNSITQCYATGAVIAVSAASDTTISNLSTGGLVGYAPYIYISESYATGAVSAQKGASSAGGISAGGLVGFLGYISATYYYQYASVSNCYALGNVFADNPNAAGGAVHAGGLVGYAQIDATKSVDHSFAAGSVTAQSNSSSAVYAGGVVGYKVSGLLTNNAALGQSVTVKGSGTARRSRSVYASPASDGTNLNGSGDTDAVGAANYALDTLRIENSSSYSTFYIVPVYSVSDTATKPNGARVSGSSFQNQIFWTSTLGFSPGYWNFGGVVSKGYPALVGVGGAQ